MAGNAVVATGEQGMNDVLEVLSTVGMRLGVDPAYLAVAATGVIGRPLPMDRMRPRLRALPSRLEGADLDAVAHAIMTTDTVPKTAWARADDALVVGVAKGVGMIAPRMATLLCFVLTDAAVGHNDLDECFRRAVDVTLNRVSIDGDTSTSDTAIVLASGLAGEVPLDHFEAALHEVLRSLARQVARDGEGATKLLEVVVDEAADEEQAACLARLVVESPLVKTAVHGADPNWGRVVMAVGNADDERLDPRRVRVRIAGVEVYPAVADAERLAAVADAMRADEVRIVVSLGLGDAHATMWGCDLSSEYVRINAEYTT
jgi:glutamate N-acetyltransferase/amino-acid N-acetyltransferase